MNPAELRRERLGTAAVASLALVGAALWCVLWVAPRDGFLGRTLDCVGADSRVSAWQRCARP